MQTSRNKRHCKHLASLLTAILLFLISGIIRVQATLLVYDGFIYPAGDSLTNSSAQGNGGSFGWGGRWMASSAGNATNYAVSLGYIDTMGNVLVTNGGSVVIGATNGITVNSQPSRSLGLGTLSGQVYSGLTGPGTYWISFMMQWIGPVTAGSTTNQYGRKGDLFLRAGINTNAASGGTALFNVGSPNAGNRIGTPYDTWSTWTGGDAAAGTQNTGLAATGSNPLNFPTFVLVRIDLDGGTGNDTVYTWFNWTNLNVEPSISTANTTNSTANEDGFNNIHVDANGGNASGTNTVLLFDEFRLGNTFADVTPHSAGAVQQPTITQQPVDTTVTQTDPATFTMTVLGAAPLHYQWYFNTNSPTAVGSDTNAFTIPSVDFPDAGQYFCVVSNAGGSVTSVVATLTVLVPVLPSISSQPVDMTNAVAFPASFSVTASGSPPLGYQWYFNTNTVLTGRTNQGISFIIGSTNDAGGYSVIVTNKFGSVTSMVAHLVINPYGPAQLPSFAGADGAAKYTSGGRGGVVYHVTQLDQHYNDSTPGTLYYGLTSVPGPKTIVFDVAGVIWLGLSNTPAYDNAWDVRSRINVSANTTVAGQTAPGPIIIMGGTVHCDAGNIIFRNVMIAPGYGMRTFDEPPNPPTPGDFPDTYAFDAMDIQGPNTMIDHVTTLFTTDESISCNEMCKILTIENCNISQAQNFPQLDAENPGTYAGHALAHLLTASGGTKVSILDNFYAHMTGRLPQVGDQVGGGGAYNDFRNCVIYNWSGGGNSSSGPSFDNLIGNFYLTGPGGYGPESRTSSNIVFKANAGSPFWTGGIGYVYGNMKDTNKNGIYTDTSSADGDLSTTHLPSALDINLGLTLSATEAFTNVLRHVGSQWWTRPYDFRINNASAIATNNVGDIATFINERLIHEAVTGTGNWIAWADDPFNPDPNEGVEWRSLLALRADPVTGAAPLNRPANWDTDGDGMPDYWEIEHGLNPNDPSDRNGDYSGDGYSNLEKYLNEVAAWPAPHPVYFTGDADNRYARIFNWRVFGQQLNITNFGNVTTYSFWQPSRYDTAVISNLTCVVDCVGQNAGILQLRTNAFLNITNGWLKLADKLDIGPGCTVAVQYTGALKVTNNIVNNGTLRLTGAAGLAIGGVITNNGLLDVMTWSGTLPAIVNNGVVLDRSQVKVGSASISGTDFVVKIQGYTGHNYQLQYRDDLIADSWHNVGSAVPGANAEITLTHPGGVTTGQRFYRVMVSP
jgi:hypothetical protein